MIEQLSELSLSPRTHSLNWSMNNFCLFSLQERFRVLQVAGHGLLVGLLLLVLVDVEVAELVGGGAGRNNVEPVADLLLLEELLRQVLEVALGEGAVSGDGELVAIAGNGDSTREVAGLAVDLDALVEEELLLLVGRARRKEV